VSISVLALLGILGPQFAFYHEDKFFMGRLILMAGMAVSGVIPTIHAYYLPQRLPLEGTMSLDDIYSGVYTMYAMFGIGLLFYVSKFPECYWPGRFDIWFHSHQLWHILVFLGTLVHYGNCLNIYLKWKQDVPGGICTNFHANIGSPVLEMLT